jgi:hypothetical protein
MEIRKSKQPYIFFQQHLYRPPKKMLEDINKYKPLQLALSMKIYMKTHINIKRKKERKRDIV